MNMSVESFVPAAIARIEITDSLQGIDLAKPADSPLASPVHSRYNRAETLITVHQRPIGVISVDTSLGSPTPEQLVASIEAELAPEIARHLEHDGISTFELTVDGLKADKLSPGSPWRSAPCWSRISPDAPLPFLSIVIATSNRAEQLRQCIDRLLDQDYPEFEIIVVDNGSSDNATKNMYYEHFKDSKNVRYFWLPEPGVSKARNVGCRAAKSDIVVFTDDDVIPDSNWLFAIARQFEIHHDVACVTGLVLPASYDHQPQKWFEEYGGFNKGYRSRIFGKRRMQGFTHLYPYTAGAFGSGNNSAFRKKEFLEFGGFDETIGPGTITRAGEDLDAFLSVIMSNRKIAYEPAAIIYHYHRDTYEALRKQLYSYGIGLSTIFAKWGWRSPKYALEILLRAPLGLWVVINPRSVKNRNKSPSFPSDLTKAELKGMAIGPLLYPLRRFGGQ